MLWNTIAHLPDMTNSSVYFKQNSLVGNSMEEDRAVQLLLKGLASYIFSAPWAAVMSVAFMVTVPSFRWSVGRGR